MTYRELLEDILVFLGVDADELDSEVYAGCLYEIGHYFGDGSGAVSFPDADIDVDLTAADEDELNRRISGEVWKKEG